MENLIERVRVLATAVVAWLVVGSGVLTAAAGEIAEVAPPGGETATAWTIRAVAWLGTAILVIRNVTTVLPQQRGLLSPPGVTVKTLTVADGYSYQLVRTPSPAPTSSFYDQERDPPS